jgi:hypothetical protein
VNKTWTRIEDYKQPVLCRGLGRDPESGMCVMQTVAWLAGEPLSDHPDCASPVLADFAIVVNDGLEQKPRQQLLQLAVPLSGSRDEARETQRAEALIVGVVAKLLAPRLKGVGEHADRLAKATSCAEILKDLADVCRLPYPGTPAGLHARPRTTTGAHQLLGAVNRFENAKTGGDPIELTRAVVEAASAGVMLNAKGDKLVVVIEEAIWAGQPPELAKPARMEHRSTGMTGKGQAATCSAKGTLPCPGPSSPAPTPPLECAGYASSTGLAA